MIAPEARFTEAARDYALYRPDYPDALVEWVGSTTGITPPGPVLDLGCGTGLSSRRFALHGYEVVGIDPNEAMLAKAREAGGGPTYAIGSAISTGLRDDAVALTISCQAFHWFDIEPTVAEIRRVCTGWAVAAWNQRTRAPAMVAYDDLLHQASTEYRAVPKGPPTITALREVLPPTVRETFANTQTLDRAGVHGRADSSSYVKHGIADLPAFHRALDRIFDTYAKDGAFTFTYNTVAIAWRTRPDVD